MRDLRLFVRLIHVQTSILRSSYPLTRKKRYIFMMLIIGDLRLGDDSTPPAPLTNFSSLATRTADAPLELPSSLPGHAPRNHQSRFDEHSIYPYLETNVDTITMEYSQEAISSARSARTIALHGSDSPFRHWTTIRDYVVGLIKRNNYEDLISYETSVERCEKVGEEWKITLRRRAEDGENDFWWTETFDAVVVASGHFSVPYVPHIEGLEDFERERPGSVLHSKMYRGREAHRGKVSCPLCLSNTVVMWELTGLVTAGDPCRWLGLCGRHHDGSAGCGTIACSCGRERSYDKRVFRRWCIQQSWCQPKTEYRACRDG